MRRNLFIQLSVLFAVALSLGGCSFFGDSEAPQAESREIAQHSENVGEGNIVTRVFEERKNGTYAIKIQVIKEGKVEETIHYFDNDNFSISVPVSARIQVQSVEEAGKTQNTGILVFSQKLEVAREAMLKTDYVKALEALNEALQIDNYNPQAHMMKGSIFYAMGQYDMARKEFDYVLKLEPENVEVKRFKEFMDSKEGESGKVKIEGLEKQ